MTDLRFGRWQDVLADVTCDTLIFDAPYSTTTHGSAGKDGRDTRRRDGYASAGLSASYDPMAPEDVRAFCESWASRCGGWWVSLTDFPLATVWREEMQRIGRYAFVPVACVLRGMSVRLQQDGPSSWVLYAVVSRPRTRSYATWGILPGAYTGGINNVIPGARAGGRGKPRWLMNAIVRDYSRRGDVVCDPFAGWGATLASCIELGRTGIGAERDPDAYAEAMRRLTRPQQLALEAG